MWSSKSNEVPLQNPRHNQSKDSTRGEGFLYSAALFWEIFCHELFETLGNCSRKHSPASVWEYKHVFRGFLFADSSFVL